MSFQNSHQKAKILIQQGERYYLQGDFTKAVTMLKKALSLDMTNLEIHYHLGIMYTRHQDYAQALRHFNEVLQSEYAYVHANHVRTMVGFIHSIQGNLMDAQGFLAEALRQDPENLFILQALGFTMYKLGDYESALKIYRRGLTIQPEHPNILNAIGYILIESRKGIAEGVEYCKKALEINPKSAAAMDSIGWGLHLLGETEAGLDYLRSAFNLLPENNDIKDHIKDLLEV